MPKTESVKLFDGRVEVLFNPGSHRYKVNGEYKPGVTSVTAILNKPNLLNWAAWMASTHFKEAITPFATTDQQITKAELKKLSDAAKKAHTVRSDAGRDVGKVVHEWIEAQLIGKEPLMPEDPLAVACIQQWEQWQKDYGIEFIKSEFIVYSEKLDYCGTTDSLVKSHRLDGKTFMLDYKTSEPEKIRNSKFVITGHKPYPEHFAQIAGYDYAHFEETGTAVDGYMVVYLPKESPYQVFQRYQPEADRQGWENLFNTYKWLSNIKGGK